jgi:hypothetical protein
MNRITRGIGVAAAVAAVTLSMALPAGAQSRATWIGAIGTDSLQGWDQMNQAIGPSQYAREYYPDTLPATFSDTYCSELEPSVICVLSYHTEEDQTDISAFVDGIPADRAAPVFIIFYDEPEAHIATGAEFVSEYENQVGEIRAACAQAEPDNCGVVQVGMIASTYQYQPGEAGASCSYIPPASYVDEYFADAYDPVLDGLANDPGFQGWKSCTQGLGVDRGLTEYGLGTCVSSGTWTEQAREEQLAADAQYLSTDFPHLYLWAWFWNDDSSVGPCKDWQFPASSVTATEWRGIEQGTVGS